MLEKHKTQEPDKANIITMAMVGWMNSFCSNKVLLREIELYHQNPVQDILVEKPEEYLFSSARNYAELPSVLDIILETLELKTYDNNAEI